MKTIHFDCYKISSKISLGKIAEFFRLPSAIGRKDYLVLESGQLDTVFKYNTALKQAYIFDFGCITLVNFDTDETGTFLEFLESITGEMDPKLFTKYHEGHTVTIYDDETCRLWKDAPDSTPYGNYIIPVVAVILARSTALYKIETDAGVLLDEAENFIHFLHQGRLHANTGRFARITAKMLRFEYDSINSIRIFDRTNAFDRSIDSREAFDRLSEYYELHDRFSIVKSKIDDLRSITGSYASLSYSNNEKRLYYFEIFLLALFPLSYVLRYLESIFGISDVFRLFFK